MKKAKQKKLSLHRETLRMLHDGSLQEAVGGIATLKTCGTPCSNVCSDVCTDACPTQGAPPRCTL
jgi:hypothetical protein